MSTIIMMNSRSETSVQCGRDQAHMQTYTCAGAGAGWHRQHTCSYGNRQTCRENDILQGILSTVEAQLALHVQVHADLQGELRIPCRMLGLPAYLHQCICVGGFLAECPLLAGLPVCVLRIPCSGGTHMQVYRQTCRESGILQAIFKESSAKIHQWRHSWHCTCRYKQQESSRNAQHRHTRRYSWHHTCTYRQTYREDMESSRNS